MQPVFENNGRWHHIASEAEVQKVLESTKAGSDYQVVELEGIGITLIATQRPLMAIIRAGAMGGGLRNVEGGWIYDNPFSLLLDWQEINSIKPKGLTR